MTIKGYFTFPKAPALLEPHQLIVLCHIQDTCWRSLTPLLRCSQCILQLQPNGPQFLSEVQQVQSQFSFLTDYRAMVKECCLPYYLSPVERRDGFMPFSRALVQSEMQTASYRVWTLVAVSISYIDNSCAKHAFLCMDKYLCWGPQCSSCVICQGPQCSSHSAFYPNTQLDRLFIIPIILFPVYLHLIIVAFYPYTLARYTLHYSYYFIASLSPSYCCLFSF